MNSWTTPASTFHTFLLVAQIEPEAIRARIRQARIEADLTQQELADLLEIHKRTIENYENVRVPEWRPLNKIARVLDRDIEWFLYGEQSRSQTIDDQFTEVNRKLDAIIAHLGLELPELATREALVAAVLASTQEADAATQRAAKQRAPRRARQTG